MAAPIQQVVSNKNMRLKGCEEVVFIGTHGNEDQNSNVGAWDVASGNLLQNFRNGSAAPYSLCLLGHESLIAASHSKPVIHIWNMHHQSQKHRKLICGKPILCLAVTPDSNFLAGGLEDKIHIWQICSGQLCCVLSHNSVDVKCLKFNHTGEYLVSGYKDGTVAVWELQSSLHQDLTKMIDQNPINTFVGHSGEITGLHITLTNKVASCAMDFTVKLWDLLLFEELMTFELGAPVCSVTIDHSEFALYAGDLNGNVYCIDLNFQYTDKSVHLSHGESSPAFTSYCAHLGPVHHLCLTADQSKLVTASDDKMVKVWSMMSSVSPLIITLNERVSNLLVVPAPQALLFPEHKPKVVISNLGRQLYSTNEADSDMAITIDIKKDFKVNTSQMHPQNQLEVVKRRSDKLKKAVYQKQDNKT